MKYLLFWYQLISINENNHNNLFHAICFLCSFCFKVLHKHPRSENVHCLMSEMGKKHNREKFEEKVNSN